MASCAHQADGRRYCASQRDAPRAHQILACAEDEPDSGALLTALWEPLVRVERSFVSTQVAMALGKWDDADAAASSATEAVEGVTRRNQHGCESLLRTCRLAHRSLSRRAQSAKARTGLPGSKAWELGLALGLTAAVFARTGRLTFAEGLLREAAKRLQLSVDVEGAASGPWRTDMHPSIPACLAWQCAQVFAANDRRSTEAQEWARRAEALWPYGRQLADQLGAVDVLKADADSAHVPCASFVLARAFQRRAAAQRDCAGTS